MQVDGCAIFWRRSKFRLAENYSVEFNECARTYAQNVADSSEHERDILSRLLKDNIAQVIILEILHPNTSSNIRNRMNRNSNNNLLTVANTHLYSNKDCPDVKLWQCLTLVRELEQLVLHRDLPLIICGVSFQLYSYILLS
jgi:CCR4-NOT transcription complex subunit 6